MYQRIRRVSYEDQRYIAVQSGEMLRDGSENASPVVFTTKKNGSKMFCCDFRRINEKILRDNFPKTLVDEKLHKLQGAQIFTTLDLKNGSCNVTVEPHSRKYTAFITSSKQYEFCFVPWLIEAI